MTDIRHPAYYNKGDIECIDYVEDQFGVVPHLAKIVEYVTRCRFKHESPVADLLKAKFYIERAIAWYERGDE